MFFHIQAVQHKIIHNLHYKQKERGGKNILISCSLYYTHTIKEDMQGSSIVVIYLVKTNNLNYEQIAHLTQLHIYF